MTLRRSGSWARIAAALALGVVLLAGCNSNGASSDCGLDQCTVTFDRGVEGSATVLGVEAKFVAADGNVVTLEVAGEQLQLTVGQPAAQVGGLAVSIDSVTDEHVAVRVARGN